MCRIICAVPISLRAFCVISASSAFLLSLVPLNPVNPVKNQPVPPPPLARGCLTPWPFVRTRCGNLRFAGARAARPPTSRPLPNALPPSSGGTRACASAGGAASCRAAFGTAWLLPLLGVSEFGSVGGFSHKEHKAPQRKCAACADCCIMVL